MNKTNRLDGFTDTEIALLKSTFTDGMWKAISSWQDGLITQEEHDIYFKLHAEFWSEVKARGINTYRFKEIKL